MAKKRLHAFFSGNVQGVFFRYNTKNFAEEAGVNGWVRNLRDGRVEVIAEADEERLNDLLKRIRAHFKGYIRNEDISWDETMNEFKGFWIEYTR